MILTKKTKSWTKRLWGICVSNSIEGCAGRVISGKIRADIKYTPSLCVLGKYLCLPVYWFLMMQLKILISLTERMTTKKTTVCR